MVEIQVSFFYAHTQPASLVASLAQPISTSHCWGMAHSSPQNSRRRSGIGFLGNSFTQIHQSPTPHFLIGHKNG